MSEEICMLRWTLLVMATVIGLSLWALIAASKPQPVNLTLEGRVTCLEAEVRELKGIVGLGEGGRLEGLQYQGKGTVNPGR